MTKSHIIKLPYFGRGQIYQVADQPDLIEVLPVTHTLKVPLDPHFVFSLPNYARFHPLNYTTMYVHTCTNLAITDKHFMSLENYVSRMRKNSAILA